MSTKLTPVIHPTLPNHYRVPMAEVGGKFEIYVGEDYVRILKEEDLPDIFKVRLAMIRAATDPSKLSDYPTLVAKAYEHPRESQLYEIGWQVTTGLYVVVVPTKDLTYLRNSQYSVGAGFIADDRPTLKYLENFMFESPLMKSMRNTKETLIEAIKSAQSNDT